MSVFGRTSPANCTTAALAAGATFTGGPDDVDEFGSVAVVYISNGNSSTLHLDMGRNGVAYEVTRAFPVAAGAMLNRVFPRKETFLRARIVNDAGAALNPVLWTTVHVALQPAEYTVDGELLTNVAASALPAGAATEATLATRASEATLATRASEATQATRASEATLATRASEATLASRATEATLAAMSAKLPVALGPQSNANSLSVVPSAGAVFAITQSAVGVYRDLNLGTTGAVIKASAGGLYSVTLSNLGLLADVFVKLYDKTTAPTSADTPIVTLRLLAGTSRTVYFGGAVAFANGLGIRASGAVADADNTAPAANTAVAEALTFV